MKEELNKFTDEEIDILKDLFNKTIGGHIRNEFEKLKEEAKNTMKKSQINIIEIGEEIKKKIEEFLKEIVKLIKEETCQIKQAQSQIIENIQKFHTKLDLQFLIHIIDLKISLFNSVKRTKENLKDIYELLKNKNIPINEEDITKIFQESLSRSKVFLFISFTKFKRNFIFLLQQKLEDAMFR